MIQNWNRCFNELDSTVEFETVSVPDDTELKIWAPGCALTIAPLSMRLLGNKSVAPFWRHHQWCGVSICHNLVFSSSSNS